MLYVKGGAAFVEVRATVTDPVINPGFVAQKSETKATWTLGGGLEWAFANRVHVHWLGQRNGLRTQRRYSVVGGAWAIVFHPSMRA